MSELLGEFFRRAGMRRAVRRAEAVLLWPQVAGPEVSRFTAARALRDGVLYVDVGDSETAMHLSLQRQRFLDVFHTRFDARDVRDVRFRVGRLEPPAVEAPAPAPAPPDPGELASLARALEELRLPDAVAAAAMRAGRSLLGYRARRQAEGWKPCPTCGALTPHAELCDACRRYAASARVQAAARRLAVAPGSVTPDLGEEERAVAARLAAESLDAAMAELMPQVLADPGLKPQLESAARCRAAIAAGKRLDELDEADMGGLPDRVRRVLGVL